MEGSNELYDVRPSVATSSQGINGCLLNPITVKLDSNRLYRLSDP